MKLKLLLIIIIFLSSSFKQDNVTKKPIIFNFSVDVEKYKSFDESNYNLSYEIVPLENEDKMMLSTINKVVMNDNYIYTLSNGQFINIFNRKGKHIKTIKNGEGDSELKKPTDLMIDDKTGNLLVFDTPGMIKPYNPKNVNKIKTYSPTGSHISTKSTNRIDYEFGKIGNRYVLYNGNLYHERYNFVVLNGDDKKYYSVRRGSHYPITGITDSQITKYNGELYFIACFDNIVYKMGEKDKEPVPYAVFNNAFADTTVKYLDLYALKEKCNKDNKFMYINAFRLINDDLISIGTESNKGFAVTLLYDKATNEVYKNPLQNMSRLRSPIGGINGKTIHYFNPDAFDWLKEAKMSPQEKKLYAIVKERYEKYGVNENSYLVIVSYNKKK